VLEAHREEVGFMGGALLVAVVLLFLFSRLPV